MSIKNIKVSNKLIGLVGIVLIPFLLVVLYTALTLGEQKNDAVVLNIAGRQRMLSQKYTKEVLQEIFTNSDSTASNNTITLFDKSLETLLIGGTTWSDVAMNNLDWAMEKTTDS